MNTNEHGFFSWPVDLIVFHLLTDIREYARSFVAKFLLIEIYCLRDGAVIVRRLAAEMFEQSKSGEPVLAARCRLCHDRFDANGAQRLGDLFHLPSPALSVLDDAPDHVARELLPIHSRKRLV